MPDTRQRRLPSGQFVTLAPDDCKPALARSTVPMNASFSPPSRLKSYFTAGRLVVEAVALDGAPAQEIKWSGYVRQPGIPFDLAIVARIRAVLSRRGA